MDLTALSRLCRVVLGRIASYDDPVGYAKHQTWVLVQEGAERLTTRDQTPFSLQELVREVHSVDPDRSYSTIQPTVQGMTVNAGTGPPSRAGKPLERVGHGLYVLRDTFDDGFAGA